MLLKPIKPLPTPQIHLTFSDQWEEYHLLDCGNGLKLEKIGPYRLIRPEAEAIWKPRLPAEEWENVQATFIPGSGEESGSWKFHQYIPDHWTIKYRDLKISIKLSTSRHIGFFPEQAPQWDWINRQIHQAHRPIKILNLFGYTGLATLAAAQAGAQVTHVDASQKAIYWAKENQVFSGLADKPIRWIVDDALKFVRRENRRRNYYDAIILDPPKFGRGPKGEVWEFYKILPTLLEDCRKLLSKNPQFILFTAYAVKASALTLFEIINEMMSDHTGDIEVGELILRDESAGRNLSRAIYANWSAKI